MRTPERPKPIASLSLDADNQWSYMKIHGDDGWESFPSYLDVLAPRALDVLARHQLRITFFVVGQDAALPRTATRSARSPTRRPRDRQPLVPPRALAPPLLGGRARRGARAGRGRDRVGDRRAHRRVPRSGLQPLGDDAAGAAAPRVRLRRVDAADVHRSARPRLLLPHREAHGRAARRARAAVRHVGRRAPRGAPVPVGGGRPHACSSCRSRRCPGSRCRST